MKRRQFRLGFVRAFVATSVRRGSVRVVPLHASRDTVLHGDLHDLAENLVSHGVLDDGRNRDRLALHEGRREDLTGLSLLRSLL